MVHPRRLPHTAMTAAALPIAALSLLAALPPTPAQAQTPGAELKVLSPRPGESLGSTSFDLDVAFQSRTKSPVVTAEFWVDGVRWERRNLETPQIKNILSFKVDASSLSEGSHMVVVKVFTANGGVSSAELQIAAGNNTGVSEGAFGSSLAMAFLSPGNGKRVSGNVEFNLDARDRTGANPYVTFYIDKQFKTLKNYPPYSYTWDTTAVANGWHTVEATGYVEASNASTTRRIRVFVDNPGGNTVRMDEVPDLADARLQPGRTSASAVAVPALTIPLPGKRVASGPKKAIRPIAVKTAPVLPRAVGGPATFAEMTMANTADIAPLSLGVRETASAAASVVDVRVVTPAAPLTLANPSLTAAASVATRAVKPIAAAAAAPTTTIPTVRIQPLAVSPAGMVGAVSAPRIVTPALPAPQRQRTTLAAPAIAARAATITPRVSPRSNSVTTPRYSVAAPNRMVAIVPEAKTTRATPRAAVRPAPKSYVQMPSRSKSLQVAFDGERIAFDVQPRVEAGLPLAPFRQIFEHTGGQVTWVKETRMVRAVNADREIVIGVGKNQARVNGQNYTMDRPAFIERGRAIVPLSFIGKALDVDVQYDPATGRLQITSK